MLEKFNGRRWFIGVLGLALLVVGGSLGPACKPKPERRTFEKRYRSRAPRVVIGKVVWGEELKKDERMKRVRGVHAVLQRMVAMVEQKDLSGLPQIVSRKKGLWIDLKTHKSHGQVARMLGRKDGYLHMFFLDSERLRRYAKDDQRIAVRDVLRYTDTLRADYYLEGDGQIEVKLFLEDYPDYNYHLNNPVFLREDGVWKVFRLF